MGTGEERFHAAQIHSVTALDAAGDRSLDHAVLFQHFLELIEDLHALGLFERKGDRPVHFVLAGHIHVSHGRPR